MHFEANGDIFYFRDLMVDDQIVSRDCYTLSAGSTVADLKSDWLNALSTGSHTIAFIYVDGRTPDADFEVYDLMTAGGEIPQTGDPGQPALLLLLIAASFIALRLIGCRKRT